MDNMNITSAQYVVDLISGGNSMVKATIDGTEMFVPLDPANRHYAEILRQIDANKLVILEAE